MKNNINNKYYLDGLSQIIFSPFNSIFFYFTVVMYVVHKSNIHTTSIRILTIHYLLRVIGDSINQGVFLSEKITTQWNLISFAYFFWYCGEIVGDFYLLSRTTPFIVSPFKNIRLILSYITFILLAFGKISLSIAHFVYAFQNDLKNETLFHSNFYSTFWNFQLYISFLSLIYDISIYFTMKVDFFDKELLLEDEDNKAWKRYRKMSRIRVKYVAITAAVTFLLVLISKMKIMKSFIISINLEYYRKILVTMPYVMMYIDQILISETDMIPINESVVHMNLYTYL